ncbi:MAG: T9SS type A sorting domain-containing protein [Bacteroidales bacterium]|nr:T9SS type A sorting domain-containing protein [Bacteroidales bacterium]
MKKLLLFLFSTTILLSGSGLLTAQDWVGSEACQQCHSEKYNFWVASGHPYKFTVIENGQPPVYPPEAFNYQVSWMTNLGDGSHTWDDIAGVIGGYGWKSRFVGNDGHIVGTAGSAYSTGLGHNQFNFYGGEDHGWVDYHPGDEKIYNYGCFKCHTTGGDMTGTWLAGVDGLGTFTEGGVGCESCHGPGGDHVNTLSADDIDKVYEFAHQDNSIGGLQIGDDVQTPDPDSDDINFLCGTCHNRSYTSPINSSGGFIKHHEQWDEFVATKHFKEQGMDCSQCHNPHKRVIWDGDGIIMTCGTCHPNQVNHIDHDGDATCLDCHMPFAAKSGTTRGESGFKGDVRSHLVKIIPDTESMFTEDGSAVKDDENRPAALSPAYACLGCHNDDPDDDIPDKTLEDAAEQAAGMHNETSIAERESIEIGIYPNPTFGPTKINFTLPNSEIISLTIYNASGQVVYSLINEVKSAGDQHISWDGNSNTGADITPGYYFVNISSNNFSSVEKLVLVK